MIMSKRNQPYLPLYVDDFANDEKLLDCSASATGVYIRLMCLMHKSESYGKVLLKQKYKRTENVASNFSKFLSRFMPYSSEEIESSIIELLDADVIQIKGDTMLQKRMVRDNELSEIRASAGKRGGKTTQSKLKLFDSNIAKAKDVPNAGLDMGIEYDKKKVVVKKVFVAPTMEEVKSYFSENGFKADAGEKAWKYYDTASWHDSTGKPVKNWKQKMQSVWFKDENKNPNSDSLPPKEGFKISRNPSTGQKYYEPIS